MNTGFICSPSPASTARAWKSITDTASSMHSPGSMERIRPIITGMPNTNVKNIKKAREAVSVIFFTFARSSIMQIQVGMVYVSIVIPEHIRD